MPTTYWKCSPEVEEMAREIIEEHRQDLHRLQGGVKIVYLYAESDGDAYAITKGGWPCEAITRLVPTRDRAAGGADVQIVLDADIWGDLTPIRRVALLHHEIHHIEPVDLKGSTNEEGEAFFICKRDSIGRPKIRLRPHDFEWGGFKFMAEIYGDDSAEVRGHHRVTELLAQQVFDFASGSSGEEAA